MVEKLRTQDLRPARVALLVQMYAVEQKERSIRFAARRLQSRVTVDQVQPWSAFGGFRQVLVHLVDLRSPAGVERGGEGPEDEDARFGQALVQPAEQGVVERLHLLDALWTVSGEVEHVVRTDVEHHHIGIVRRDEPIHVVDHIVHLRAAKAALNRRQGRHVLGEIPPKPNCRAAHEHHRPFGFGPLPLPPFKGTDLCLPDERIFTNRTPNLVPDLPSDDGRTDDGNGEEGEPEPHGGKGGGGTVPVPVSATV